MRIVDYSDDPATQAESLINGDFYTSDSLNQLSAALAKLQSAIDLDDKELIRVAYANVMLAIDSLNEVEPVEEPTTQEPTEEDKTTTNDSHLTDSIVQANDILKRKKC